MAATDDGAEDAATARVVVVAFFVVITTVFVGGNGSDDARFTGDEAVADRDETVGVDFATTAAFVAIVAVVSPLWMVMGLSSPPTSMAAK